MQKVRVLTMISVIVTACSGDPSGGGPGISQDSGPGGSAGGLIRSTMERASNPAPAPDALGAVAAGNTTFALDLYRETRSGTGNVAFSPFSISLAMAMVWAGSQGTAAQEIAGVLHFTRTQAETHTAFDYLDQHLENPSNGFALHLASSLWLLPDSNPKAPFLDTLAFDYGAGVHVVDLTNGAVAAPAINDWVSQETSGKISSVVSPSDFDPFTRLAVANAIHFSGRWQAPFDATRTQSAAFTRVGGTVVQVPTMASSLVTTYAEGPDYQAAVLPYEAAFTSASLLVIAPTSGQLDAFAQSLDAAKLTSIVGGLQLRTLDLTIPRFAFDPGTIDLGRALSALGMPDVFVNVGADFSPMAALFPTRISRVLHHATVSVDELGTEAAAATAVILSRDAGIILNPPPPPAPAVLHVDRPFLFLVRDDATGTILFLGEVDDPS